MPLAPLAAKAPWESVPTYHARRVDGPILGCGGFRYVGPGVGHYTTLEGVLESDDLRLLSAEKQFGKRVRAYYFFTAPRFQEFGTLGYEDQGHQYTATYKKLF